MNGALIRKNLDESKWLMLGCFMAVIVICAVRIWIVSQIETSNFRQIIEWLPGDLEKLSAVPFSWIITYPGRIALTYQEPIIILCLAVWCIARGSDCVSGELGRGTMEMLIAQPISRMQFLHSHTFVTVAGVVLITLGTFVGVWLGIELTVVHEKIYPTVQLPFFQEELPLPFMTAEERHTPMREKANLMLFVPAACNYLAFGIMLSGLTAFMSSWDRYRWRTIGIITAFHICQVLTKLLGMASTDFSWVLYLSIYSAYEPEVAVRIADVQPESVWQFWVNMDGMVVLGTSGYCSILLAFGIMGFLAAGKVFKNRDLPAPT
jgi:ABC-2 type transport system permease protein